MNTKHTPAPWNVTDPEPGDKEIRVYEPRVLVDFDDVDPDEALANARLIAAAPDLLLACLEAYGVLTEPGMMDLDEWKRWKKKTVAMLHATVERATGEAKP